VFNYIQEFQGFIQPGVVAVFLVGFLLPRAPGSSGVLALAVGPVIYGVFFMLKKIPGVEQMPVLGFLAGLHFLIHVMITFLILIAGMLVLTIIAPLSEPRKLPEREGFEMKTPAISYAFGGLVILGALSWFVVFA